MWFRVSSIWHSVCESVGGRGGDQPTRVGGAHGAWANGGRAHGAWAQRGAPEGRRPGRSQLTGRRGHGTQSNVGLGGIGGASSKLDLVPWRWAGARVHVTRAALSVSAAVYTRCWCEMSLGRSSFVCVSFPL